MKKILYSAICMGLLSFSVPSYSQEIETKPEDDLFVLSLEELMNTPISSASKKEETLFDAPLSSYTITRSDIDKAGSTSIMEALRLSPGVIVREQTNGVYDIHIRGMENLSRTDGAFLKANSYTLVMIDNRPVFNHALGGTFWESLPIDINDVERIEIVRGPSSPLFGPNAVTGVINIITKRLGSSKNMISANVQQGTSNTSIANMSLGRAFSEKFSVIISGNYQNRERFDTNYYKDSTGTYAPLDELIPNAFDRNRRYPNPSRSLNKWGVNTYLNYKPSENISIDLSLSTQGASSQRVFTTNPIQYSSTNNTAANLAVKIHALKIRTSYLNGYNADIKYSVQHGVYDYQVRDVIAEYDFKIGENYTITPGASFQSVQFDDRKYSDPSQGVFVYFKNEVNINTTAGFIRSDLNFTDKFRVIAGLRVDKFSTPDKAYLAYELLGTYKLNKNNLIRAAVTRSNSGSFIGYNYLNIDIPGVSTIGNQNMKLFTLSMIEIGYRSQLSSKLQFDIDVFRQKGENLSVVSLISVSPIVQTQFNNTPTTALQVGTTFSFNYVPNDKLQFKPFVTLQNTKTKNLPLTVGYPIDYVDPKLAPVTYTNSDHDYTPSLYGGFYLNYRPVSKLNLNLNSYFLGKQSQYDLSWKEGDTSRPNQYAQGQIKSKFMLNLKVSYEVIKGLNVFANARNLFSTKTREFYAADQTAGLYTGGLTYNLLK